MDKQLNKELHEKKPILTISHKEKNAVKKFKYKIEIEHRRLAIIV